VIGHTAANAYTALMYNAHLFGRTAEYFRAGGADRQETGFYFHDAERLPEIIGALRKTNADFVGLAEIWDGGMSAALQDELRDLYPYAAVSPAFPGLGALLSRAYELWPRLAEALFAEEGGIVNLFSRRHYSLGKTSLISDNRIGLSLASFLRSGSVLGAGLLFLSRHPFVSRQFIPHPVRADWEHLAQKGVLWAPVRLPDGQILRTSVGHYQEGVSAEALSARRAQIRKTSETIASAPEPVLAMADYNVAAGTLEYEWMMGVLQLLDPGSEETYEDPNPYQDKLKAPRTLKPSTRRLDYILHSEDIEVLSVQALNGEFHASCGRYPLSDHRPVLAHFVLHP
jgi:endonuclease/exonuclease/phosphatase family metal-dependent hydrolase